MEQQFENIAFISYNHKDKKAAKALMRKLESFKLPTSIKKDYPEAPTKLRKIFRDEDCLTPGGNSLPQKIQDELKNSKYLVVVCSMNSAKSEWVNEEVKFFKELKREKFIIPYIIDGEPNSEDDTKECYMPELRSITGKDELYAVNIAENGDKHAQVKIIAGLIDVKFDRLWQRERRAERRKRFIVISSVVVFALVSLFVALWMWNMKNKADAERDKAYMAQSRAVAGMVKQNMDKEDVVTSIAVLLEVLPDSIDIPNRPYVGEACQMLYEYDKFGLSGLFVHDDKINSASFSPDGRCVVTASNDSTAKIWDAKSGELLGVLQHGNVVRCAEFSPDNKQILTFIDGGTQFRHRLLLIWNVATGELACDSIINSYFLRSCISFTPNCFYVLEKYGDKEHRIRNITTTEYLSLGGKNYFYRAVFSPDGKQLAVASEDNDTVTVWNIDTKDILFELPHNGRVNSVDYSCCGNHLVTASSDGITRVWDTHSGKLIYECMQNSVVTSASFSKDGKTIVTSDNSGRVIVWDAKTGNMVADTIYEGGGISSVSFSPDGNLVLVVRNHTGGYSAHLWCADKGKLLGLLTPRHDYVCSASLSSDGKYLLTTPIYVYDQHDENRSAKLWKVYQDVCDDDTLHHRNKVTSLMFSYDGNHLVTTEGDDTVRIWNCNTGELSMKLHHAKKDKYGTCRVSHAEFSKSGEFVIGSLYDCAIIWNAKSGQIVCDTIRHSSFGNNFATFSRNDSCVLTFEHMIPKVWSTKEWKEIDDPVLAQQLLRETVYSHDDKYFVCKPSQTITISGRNWFYEMYIKMFIKTQFYATDMNMVLVINAETYKPVGYILHDHNIASVKFSYDGNYLLTSSSYDTISRIYYTKTSECVLEENGSLIAMSPDMKTIAIAKGNEVIIKPFIEPQQLITKYRKIFKNYKLSREDRRKYFLE